MLPSDVYVALGPAFVADMVVPPEAGVMVVLANAGVAPNAPTPAAPTADAARIRARRVLNFNAVSLSNQAVCRAGCKMGRLLARRRRRSRAMVRSTRRPSRTALRLLSPCRRGRSKLGTSVMRKPARAT